MKQIVFDTIAVVLMGIAVGYLTGRPVRREAADPILLSYSVRLNGPNWSTLEAGSDKSLGLSGTGARLLNESSKWNPLFAVGLGFLVSFIVLGFSFVQNGKRVSQHHQV